MDNQGTGTAPRGEEARPARRDRIFLRAGDDPLPEGVEEGDEGVFVIRLVAPTREDVEAANVAY
jgi:hypothetical protein